MGAVRITGGALRGRRIPVPKSDVRPTAERARQAFFNIVAQQIEGSRFLDLFAGTGIFAFEAVSRGSREAVAIDKSRTHIAMITKTAETLEVPVRAIAADVPEGLERLGGEGFDIVYADPPYAYELYDELLVGLDAHAPLASGAIVAIEHRRRSEPFLTEPSRLRFTRRAEYGEVWISFFKA